MKRNLLFNKAYILIIEDQPMTEIQMGNIFGYHFIIRRTVYGATDLLTRNAGNIQLIIIDDMVRNSIKIIKDIRSRYKSIPVYFMTSNDLLKFEALKNGVTGFIPEPFDVNSLKSVFAKHCDLLEGGLPVNKSDKRVLVR
ncbi:MAG: response regulator [bacterium]|nr:response regulator [bacterium]